MVVETEAIRDLHGEIKRARAANRKHWQAIPEYRAYLEGDQADTITPDQRAALNGLLRRPYVDNLARIAVFTTRDRLRILRYEADHQSTAVAEAVSEWLAEFCVKAGMPEFQGVVHEATLGDGNAAVIRSWDRDSQRVRLQLEPWWDGKGGVFFVYDRKGATRYAVKEWRERGEGRFRTVYYRDKIERYRQTGNGWEPAPLDTDTGWPEPWVNPDTGEPLGIAVDHFRNGRDLAGYGRSELAGNVLTTQDHVNDLHRQILAAGRKTAYQVLVGTGITPDLDDDGKPIPMVVEPGDIITDENPDAKFYAIEPAVLTPLLDAIEGEVSTFSRGTDTPLHYITREWPAGIALYRAEMPQMMKARNRVGNFGPVWGQNAHRSIKLANAFGRAGLDETALIRPIFEPPDALDPETRTAIAEKEAAFVSRRETLRNLGKTPDEIERILNELDEDRARDVSSLGAGLALRRREFESGVEEEAA